MHSELIRANLEGKFAVTPVGKLLSKSVSDSASSSVVLVDSRPLAKSSPSSLSNRSSD